MLDTPKSDGLGDLLDAGISASRLNDIEAAVRLFADACAAFPTDARPQFLMGSELAAAGRIDEAEAALANAVLLAPDFHIARYQLGLLQFSAARVAAALVTWAPLAALNEDSPLRHFVQGCATLAQDDLVCARARFEAGLSLDGEKSPAAADVEKVLRALPHASGDAPSPQLAREETSGRLHVLISNYGNAATTVH